MSISLSFEASCQDAKDPEAASAVLAKNQKPSVVTGSH